MMNKDDGPSVNKSLSVPVPSGRKNHYSSGAAPPLVD